MFLRIPRCTKMSADFQKKKECPPMFQNMHFKPCKHRTQRPPCAIYHADIRGTRYAAQSSGDTSIRGSRHTQGGRKCNARREARVSTSRPGPQICTHEHKCVQGELGSMTPYIAYPPPCFPVLDPCSLFPVHCSLFIVPLLLLLFFTFSFFRFFVFFVFFILKKKDFY